MDREAAPRAGAVRGSESGIGRSTARWAEAVSDDLRRGRGPLLDRRRRVAALSLGAIGALGGVAAYQTGLVRHLPEPPLPLFDAERVDASGEAYRFSGTPDAALGIASYAATLALAGMGTRNRAREQPWIPLALAAKVLLDAAGGVYLGLEQATKHRRFCSWCVAAAAASAAMVLQVLPEARLALGHVTRRG